jgi:hypothetical protein
MKYTDIEDTSERLNIRAILLDCNPLTIRTIWE